MRMKEKWKALIILLLIPTFIITACTRTELSIEDPLTKGVNYEIRLLLVQEDDSYLPLYQQLSQSLVVGLNLDVVKVEELKAEDLDHYDVVYLHDAVTSIKQDKQMIKRLRSFVTEGGTLILPHKLMDMFPKGFTGVVPGEKIDLMETTLEYPELGVNYEGIQQVARAFEEDYRSHVKKPTAFEAAKLNSGQMIIGAEGQSLLSVKEQGKGRVINLSDFLPNYSQYITGYDFQERGEANQYFQFFYSSGNSQLLNELMGYVAKEQYGVALKKVMGVNGSPVMAWQNHYEVLTSIKNLELITWIDMLKEYNQIPTFTLVRGSYDWGEWYGTLTYHTNIGTNTEPVFIGEEEESYYSNGQFIKNPEGDYITFGQYPEEVSYYSAIDKNFRPYPYFVDYNGNGLLDIIVGTHDGRLKLLINRGTAQEPVYGDGVDLTHKNGKGIQLGANTAPTVLDYNANGRLDLIVGNEAGELWLLINQSNTFEMPQPLKNHKGEALRMEGDAAPFAVDFDGDGIVDLLVGDAEGYVYLLKGMMIEGQLSFGDPEELKLGSEPIKVASFAAPHGGDYNQDGSIDLLVGDGTGDVHIFLREENNLVSEGTLPTVRKNIYGKNTLYTGKNVVPFLIDYNGNGVQDLVTGQLSFALAYDTSSETFPHREELLKSLDYARENYIPIMPHIYFHSHKDSELEKLELALHQENFKKLGLPWKYTGTNQHTWRVNIDNPVQSFKNMMEYNIWHDLAFKTPNAPSDPTFGPDYIWPIPFMMMEGKERLPLVMSTPAPYIGYYLEVYDHLALMDLPLSFFEHIEYKITEGAGGLDHLKNMIQVAETIRSKYQYAFVTEEQMAKSFINGFYTSYEIQVEDDKLVIIPDTSQVPAELAEEYLGTGGIKVELGESMKDRNLVSDAVIQYAAKGGLYIGVSDKTSLSFLREAPEPEAMPIVLHMVNGPLKLNQEENQMVLEIDTPGMQELKFTANTDVEVIGENLRVKQEDQLYTVTHYGEKAKITLKW